MADEHTNGNGATKANVQNHEKWLEKMDERLNDVRELIATNHKGAIMIAIMLAGGTFAPLQSQIFNATNEIQQDICDIITSMTIDYTRRDDQLLQSINELRLIEGLDPLPELKDLRTRPNC